MTLNRTGLRESSGFSLVELLVTLTIMAGVLGVLSTVLISSDRAQRRTTRRAEIQASSRQALALMTTELRQAGADPSVPPVGIVGVMAADSHTVRTCADANADGAIQTTEPSEDVTYTFNAVAGTLTRNPGSGAVATLDRVSDLRFTYFDATGQPLTTLPLNATDRALVRSIGLTMTCTDRDSVPYTHATRVTLRNQAS